MAYIKYKDKLIEYLRIKAGVDKEHLSSVIKFLRKETTELPKVTKPLFPAVYEFSSGNIALFFNERQYAYLKINNIDRVDEKKEDVFSFECNVHMDKRIKKLEDYKLPDV